MIAELAGKVFDVKYPGSFSGLALDIFRLHAEKNSVYKSFIDNLGTDPSGIGKITDIPFLPATVFKTRKVLVDGLKEQIVFESSRTTGSVPGRHYIYDPGIYIRSFLTCFNSFYGDPSSYFIGALLPSYTERQNSSLIFMMNELIKRSGDSNSGFYRENPDELVRNISLAGSSGLKTLLIGVSFALLDMANDFSTDLNGTIIMETGGMKGRRKEITRDELHSILKQKLNVGTIHSEYGMTELLSQAYSGGNGIFFSPPWMKILIRDPRDPLSVTDQPGIPGGINIIDLANIYSCPFISTGDYGKINENGGFEVTGRIDNTDIRGCNLMVD